MYRMPFAPHIYPTVKDAYDEKEEGEVYDHHHDDAFAAMHYARIQQPTFQKTPYEVEDGEIPQFKVALYWTKPGVGPNNDDKFALFENLTFDGGSRSVSVPYFMRRNDGRFLCVAIEMPEYSSISDASQSHPDILINTCFCVKNKSNKLVRSLGEVTASTPIPVSGFLSHLQHEQILSIDLHDANVTAIFTHQ